MSETQKAEIDGIEATIERSSLGTPEAKGMTQPVRVGRCACLPDKCRDVGSWGCQFGTSKQPETNTGSCGVRNETTGERCSITQDDHSTGHVWEPRNRPGQTL